MRLQGFLYKSILRLKKEAAAYNLYFLTNKNKTTDPIWLDFTQSSWPLAKTLLQKWTFLQTCFSCTGVCFCGAPIACIFTPFAKGARGLQHNEENDWSDYQWFSQRALKKQGKGKQKYRRLKEAGLPR